MDAKGNRYTKKISALLLIFFFIVQAGNSQAIDLGRKMGLQAHEKLVSIYSNQKLNQLLSLNIEHATLREALQQVAVKANLILTFSGELESSYKSRSLQIADITVREALNQLLNGTNLTYEISRNQFLIVKNKPQNLEAFQPRHIVSGTVTDAQTGESLPGVNIVVKGTTAGTSTDLDGQYSLNVSGLQDTLIFSFIGYQTQEVSIDGRTDIDVALQLQTLAGEELVVVGYGEQTKTSLTGSVSSVNNEDLRKSPAVNVGNSLAGKVTGLHIVQPSGQPGGDAPQLFLRGIGSLSSGRSQPLIIVDGVERDMFQLEPNNIESINILKDASATAVYGVRGANGAIVVQTKRGSEGPMKISVNLSSGLQQPTNIQEFVDSYTYATLYNQAQLDDGFSPDQLRFSDKALEAFRTHSDPLIYPDMDWIDYITKPAAFQTRNTISISGGTQDVKYFVSGGYLNQDGLFKTFNSEYDYNPSFTKYNFRTNLDVDATSSTRISLTGYGRVEKRVRTRSADPLWRSIYWGAPFAGAGIVDGKLVSSGWAFNNEYISCCKLDPLLRYFGQGYNEHVNNVLSVDIGIDQKLNFIIDGLAFMVKGSYNTVFTQNKYRSSSQVYYSAYYRTDVDPAAPGDSTIVFRKVGTEGTLGYSEDYGRDRQWYFETRLEYNQDFGPHNVKGLLLYNQQKDFYPAEYRGIPRGLVSMVSRINYNYDDRYLLEANMGYNGSENFAREKRFGFFPSISGGWIVTNEPFMDDVSFLNHLKLRASYGIVGNDLGIGRFLYLQDSYSASAPGYSFGVEVPQERPGAEESRIGNPQVQWETAAKQNYGIDLELLGNSLNLSFDYFYENRENILTTLNTVPAYVAAALPAVNIGEVENKGYEAAVEWRQQVGNDFFYYINANVSFARNKILYMDEVPRNEPYQRRTGQPVGQIFGYVFDSFFTEEDLEPNSGVPEHPYQAKPGDLQFKDLNGDGIINEDDQQPVGYPEYPEYSFGANIGFNYKNFDFTMVWAGAANVSRLLEYEPYRHEFGGDGAWSLMKWHAEGRWTPEKGEDAIFPRLSTTVGQRYNNMDSDFWMRDASYIRLKNAEIGYNLSPGFLQKIGLRNMRVYMNGYNLLTFSKLNSINLDPEENTNAYNAAYPVVKVYNFGINVDF